MICTIEFCSQPRYNQLRIFLYFLHILKSFFFYNWNLYLLRAYKLTYYFIYMNRDTYYKEETIGGLLYLPVKSSQAFQSRNLTRGNSSSDLCGHFHELCKSGFHCAMIHIFWIVEYWSLLCIKNMKLINQRKSQHDPRILIRMAV